MKKIPKITGYLNVYQIKSSKRYFVDSHIFEEESIAKKHKHRDNLADYVETIKIQFTPKED